MAKRRRGSGTYIAPGPGWRAAVHAGDGVGGGVWGVEAKEWGEGM